jgi:signal transduction histidine kinase
VRRIERVGIAVLAVALVAGSTAYHGWPTTLLGNIFTALLLASGLTLMWWRTHPRAVALAGGGLLLAATLLDAYGWFPDICFAIMAVLALVAALGWSGPAAWVAAAGFATYLLVLELILGSTSDIPLIMFTVPSFLAGTVLRLRREAANQLARRNLELEEERELFTELAVRHERSRIAAELHDIVGHAISVMVIQAAAGQRLVDRDPLQAAQVFSGIAESARQGHDDLQRLVELLGGSEVSTPDLSLIDEVVTRAARGGLDVSCRFEGDRDGLAAPTAHIAFRVVQESLTNALRHAPGAAVRILINGSPRSLTITIENDQPTRAHPHLSGTGHGLIGLRQRLQEQSGHLTAGPLRNGGWQVKATLPTTRTRPTIPADHT